MWQSRFSRSCPHLSASPCCFFPSQILSSLSSQYASFSLSKPLVLVANIFFLKIERYLCEGKSASLHLCLHFCVATIGWNQGMTVLGLDQAWTCQGAKVPTWPETAFIIYNVCPTGICASASLLFPLLTWARLKVLCNIHDMDLTSKPQDLNPGKFSQVQKLPHGNPSLANQRSVVQRLLRLK